MTRYDPYTDRFIMGDGSSMLHSRENPAEEVYDKFTDTVGNIHWTGTRSGKHIIPANLAEVNDVHL